VTDERTVREQVRPSGSIWLGAVAVLAVLVGVGVVVWIRSPGFRYPETAEASMEEYFEAKSKGWIKEVTVEGEHLYVTVNGRYIRNNTAYRHLHVVIPPSTLQDPNGYRNLQDGIEPSRFHVK
jgi:hypothetical protein